jgi:aspartate carbamoyltransferase catalytic subunit
LWNLNDVISINDFSRESIETVLETARKMESLSVSEKKQILQNKTVASLFFEPSTRTRLSFETAAQNMGASVIGFSEPKATSLSKGETLTDTIHMVSRYADFIVMRHFLEGAARRAAEISRKPVLNAGDGSNQHPTQTLLDLYTIRKKLGKLNGLKIALAGDLKYGRTVHSLAVALAKFSGNELFFVAPDSLRMPEEIMQTIGESVRVHHRERLEEVLPAVDVLYMTRIQKERFSDLMEYEKVQGIYRVTPQLLETAQGIGVMHPLPRVNEIAVEVDSLPNAWYFEQAANGVPVREALFYLLNEAKK